MSTVDITSPMSGPEFAWIRQTAGYTLQYLSDQTTDPKPRSVNWYWLIQSRPRVPETVSMLLERLLGARRLESLRAQYAMTPEAAVERSEREKATKHRHDLHRSGSRNPMTPLPPIELPTTMDPKEPVEPDRKTTETKPKRKPRKKSKTLPDSQTIPTPA